MATTASTNTLNSLLRGETAAIETYKQALSSFDDATVRGELRRIQGEHEASVSRLRDLVRDRDAEPSETSGTWGYWASLFTGTAQLFGDSTTLAALRTGEEHGASDYESALQDDDVSEEVKTVIRQTLLPRCQSHVAALNVLIDRLGK